MLVTSVAHSAGKTRLLEALRDEFQVLAPGDVAFVRFHRLTKLTPDDFKLNKLVLIDGPPAADSDSLIDMPQNWTQAIDGVIVVVVKRQTRRAELEETSTWLTSVGLPVFGVVWNEHLAPPLFVFLRELRRRARSWWRGLLRRKSSPGDGA